MQFGEVFHWFTRKNNKNQIWFEIHFKFSYYFSNYCAITFFNFSTYTYSQSLRWRAKAKKYICRVRTCYKVHIGIVPEAFSRENFQHLREICEKMPQKCNSWYGQLTFFRYCIYTYKYQQHLDDTKEVSTGIFKKKVYTGFKKKFIEQKVHTWVLGFKADVKWPPFFISTQNFHLMLLLRNFENSSNTAKNSQKKRIEEKPYSTCLLT